MVVDVSFFGAKTCSHLLESWALAWYLSHSFQLYISSRKIPCFTLFEERREQKKLSRRVVFGVERNEDVDLLRARALTAFVSWKKWRVTKRGDTKEQNSLSDDRSKTHKTQRTSYLRVTSLLETVAFKRTDWVTVWVTENIFSEVIKQRACVAWRVSFQRKKWRREKVLIFLHIFFLPFWFRVPRAKFL